MADEERVRLRDGSMVIVRPVRSEDRELFISGFARMSEESRYRRFMSHKKKLTDRELDGFTRLDHELHEAVGALDAVTGAGAGVARMERYENDPQIAEAAVTVIDEWQGKGLGSVLLERLTARARELGVAHFEATLFTSNRAMLRLFQKLGCVRAHREGLDVIVIDVALPIEEVDGALAAVAAV